MKEGLVILAIALVGCTSYAPQSRIDAIASETPARWAATREGRRGIDTDWVDRIGGSRLSSLVDEAFSANPDMRVAAERVNRAVASARTAGAALRPKVEAGLTADRDRQVFVGLPFGGSNTTNNFGSSLTVTWEPDVWGFNRAGQSARLAEAQAEGQAYRAARASLAAQVARAWLALAESNEQISLAFEARELRQKTISIVRDRFENALTEEGGALSQLRLAESELAGSEAAIAQRQGEKEQAKRQLELLMGRYPVGQIASEQKLPQISSMPPAGLPSELLLRRPDILEAERQFAASGKRLTQGRLAFYPSIQLTARGGTRTDELRNLLQSGNGIWSLGSALTQPIWNGGALRSEYARLKAEDRQALASLQSVVLRAFGEVEQALVADRFFAQRLVNIEKALTSATEAAADADANYVGGTGDALTLITALSNRIDLASQLVTLKRLRLDNRITLHLALGGDYRVGK